MAAVSAAASRRPVPWRPVASLLARAAVGGMCTLAVTIAGTGWLYLLRRVGALDVGPHLREALPLQRLAGDDAQPLARLALAWVPAGVVAGAALRALGIRRAAARIGLTFVPCLLVLMLFAAASDAITETEAISGHLSAQPHRVAIWVAAALVALGAAP